MTSNTYRAGERTVGITHADRVIFPADGITKGDLVNYYGSVAPLMLPHVKDRPITMNRFPDGISGGSFVQQAVADYYPDWLGRARVAKEGGEIEHPLINSQASLVYLVNQNCIVFHTWLSRVSHPEQPDRIVFDLDPSDDDFEKVRQSAFIIRDMLDDMGLVPFVMTTGSRGVHVTVPVRPSEPFDDVRSFARGLADIAAERHPGLMTTEQRKNKRGDRVYIDTLRNSYGQSAVAPYSVRAKPGAPVATPLTWGELHDGVGPRSFTIKDLPERAADTGDIWQGMTRHARSISGARGQLERMRQ